MHKKLFIPGPTEVLDDVLAKLATPQIGHRSSDFKALYNSIVAKLRVLLYTQNQIILSTSSGTGLMEAAARNFIGKKCLSTICGEFSQRWFEIAKVNGKNIEAIKVEPGKHVPTALIDEKLATGEFDCLFYTVNETSTGIRNPIEELAVVMKKYPNVIWCVDAVSAMGGDLYKVDELGVDYMLASTQKSWALPSGLSLATVSEKAIEKAKTVENRGYYFDIVELVEYAKKDQTPTTPAIPHLFALEYQLGKIIAEGGMEARYARHLEMAKYVRGWVAKHFALFTEPGFESVTLTTATNTRGISVEDLNKQLAKRGKTLSNGYGPLKEKTFRIAHMGDLTLTDLKELTKDIEEILGI